MTCGLSKSCRLLRVKSLEGGERIRYDDASCSTIRDVNPRRHATDRIEDFNLE